MAAASCRPMTGIEPIAWLARLEERRALAFDAPARFGRLGETRFRRLASTLNQMVDAGPTGPKSDMISGGSALVPTRAEGASMRKQDQKREPISSQGGGQKAKPAGIELTDQQLE